MDTNRGSSRSSESVDRVIVQSQDSKDASLHTVGSDANMVRSVQLQEEWGILRAEMDTLVAEMTSAPAPTEDQVKRKEEIASRMTYITKEMTDILARAQEKLPPTPSHPGAKDVDDGPPVRSKTGKHRIERTYDSSDSDGNPPESRKNQEITLFDVSEEERNENLQEKPSVRVGNDRTVLTTLGTKLMSTLQKAQNTLGGTQVTITEEEKEALKLEESRLEREVRSMKRNADGPPDHNTEKRMEEITKRLKEIADLTLDNGGVQAEDKATQESSGSLAMKARAFVSTVSGHGREKEKPKDKDDGAANAQSRATGAKDGAAGGDNGNALPSRKKSIMEKAETTGKKAASGFSKKWGAFKGAVGKKMGKNKTDTTGAARSAAAGTGTAGGSSSNPNTPPNGMAKQSTAKSTASGSGKKNKKKSTKSPNAGSPSTVQSTAGGGAGNVHDDVNQAKQRLAERGEKLENVANETAAMREDASDFLAAARALRKKNEKKGLFT